MITDCEKTVVKISKAMKGKTNIEALIYLCEMAQTLEVPGLFVDLGTYYGRSAMVMVQGSFGNGYKRKVVTIDNYQEGINAKHPESGGQPNFWQVSNQFRCKGRAVLIYGDTAEVPLLCRGEPIALVFVDGDHTREGLMRDMEAWKPLVVPGGVMLFDDYGNSRWPDVRPTVDKYMWDWERLEQRGSVVGFRRPAPEDAA